MEEIWKPMEYKGNYYGDRFEISNTGEIRRKEDGKILKTTPNPQSGRKQVCISIGSRKKKKIIKVHIAVASTFVDGYKHGLTVNHKDGNVLNNNASNLEWISQKENIAHALEHGLIKSTAVVCVDMDVEFKTLTDAEKATGDSRTTIMRRIKAGSLKQTVHGHMWTLPPKSG